MENNNQEPPTGAEIEERVLMLPPEVGMTSLVWFDNTDYPIKNGNYCSIRDGPYLANMWAENLQEWARRNPDSGPIAVTEYCHGGRGIGLVTDSRMAAWCNAKPCVTGIGWPSVAVMRLVCDRMSAEYGPTCGCESDEQSPQISQHRDRERPGRVTYVCWQCKRRWEVDKE